jgi:hypothetical protein
MSDDDREQFILQTENLKYFPKVPQFFYVTTNNNNNNNNNEDDENSNSTKDSDTTITTTVEETDQDNSTSNNNTAITTFKQWKESAKALSSPKFLGEYLARITLRGGYTIPLKIEVVKR